ncbi:MULTISPECIES: VOC family protein [Gulosibacter]|uniref:VOC family protein n=1 Tax=Gulosibacter TaxID=256818 RepID=UPI000F64032B|nr:MULTISPECIES: VOC family protein [Gulosibacter]
MTTNESQQTPDDDALSAALAHSDEVRHEHHSDGQLDAPAAGTTNADDTAAEAAPTAERRDAPAEEWSTGRPVHFEIHAADPKRAAEFYSAAFGWKLEDWSEYAGMPYFGATTGVGNGIDGAIMQRQGENPPTGGPVAGAVITIGVADFDAAANSIQAAGGTVALPKYALPGMAWQGYFVDTENNVFGIHQADPNAA